MPWPNDIRARPDGTIDFSGYPGSETSALVALVLERGSADLRGFGTNAAIQLRSTAPIDPASIPPASASTAGDSPIMLVNLDQPTDPRVPVLVDFKSTSTAFRPANLLTLLPYPGHPLNQGTRYAAIVFDGVLDADGRRFAPAPLIANLANPWHEGNPVDQAQWDALREQREAVLDYVGRYTDWQPQDVVAFTVFTTQNVTGQMQAIATAIEELPLPLPLFRTNGSCPQEVSQTTVTGQIEMPKWQQGEFPYTTEGGAVIVRRGRAVQQSTERVEFEMTFPCGPAPPDGWPILLFMGGRGTFANSASIPELGSETLPYVVASIAPLYSGDRARDLGLPGFTGELLYYNYLNPVAGRTNQLQQAADMIYLKRVIQGIVLSASETGTGASVQTNDDLVVIAGQGQGALTVPLVLAVDDSFDAGFISAGGAGLYNAAVYRADIRALIDGLVGTTPGELDMFHPLVHALQTLAEVGDPANYGSLITKAHVVSVGGQNDGCAPIEAAGVLGITLGLDMANPLVYPIFGSLALEPRLVGLPVAGNLPGSRTGVIVQLDAGHFGASVNPSIGGSFVRSLASQQTAGVDPGPLRSDPNPGCDGRFAAGGTHTPAPANTPTNTVAPTPTETKSHTPVPASATPTPSSTVSPSPGAESTPTPTNATATPTDPTPQPTLPSICAGDCSDDGVVTVSELVQGVNIALGIQDVSTCPKLDIDGVNGITVNELVAAANNALRGC
jgi:hypothetical protein